MAESEQQQQSPDPHSAVSSLLHEAITNEDAGSADDTRDQDKADDKVNLDDKPPEGEQLDDVTKLLADDQDDDGGDADRDEDKPRGKVGSLAELAEQLGVKPEALYKLQIPMREDGTVLTLGELKDQAGKALDLDDMSVEVEERRTAFENDMIRSRQELSDIVSLLPEVSPALIEHARASRIEIVDRERNSLLEIMPAWKDDKVFQSARDDILEAVADYGFLRSDLDLVVDFRLTKLLHDFAGMKKRIAAANARAKEIRDALPKGGKRVSERAQRQRTREAAANKARTGSDGDKAQAVGQILLGGDAA